MSVKMRPINNSDKARMTLSAASEIKVAPLKLDTADTRSGSVMSSSIFSTRNSLRDSEHFKDMQYEDEYTRVGYIELTKRVLNPFLAGRKAPVWRSVLGLKEDNIMKIIEGSVLFDLEEQREIPVSVVGTKPFDFERYIFGADYLEYLLNRVDINSKIEKNLIGEFVYPLLTRKEAGMFKDGVFNIGHIVKLDAEDMIKAYTGEYQGWIFGRYALDMSDSDFTEYRKQEISDGLYDLSCAADVVNLKQFPTISILTALAEDGGLNMLKSQLMEYLFVLPYGYRPTIDSRVDQLSIQYNKLELANLELHDILDQKAPSCYSVTNKYREVVRLVRNIFIGDDDEIKSQRLKDYKSISDTITGKEGLMRGRMQGARIDNSARTVITQDPFMPIDCIGVPRKILAKVAEPSIIKGLRKYRQNGEKFGAYGGRNLSTFSTTSRVGKDNMTYEEFMELWFKEKPRYGIIGRQPTLFYLGMQGFKIIPVDGDSIILSPLIVMPFNADFDGDQMHFNMPVTDAAVKELRENMLFTNNIRYPKNGEITVVTRHEIVYGLWACKWMTQQKTGRTWNMADLQNLALEMNLDTNSGQALTVYEGVCCQKINVYDMVQLKGMSQFAGLVALRYAICGNTASDLSTEFYDFSKKAKSADKKFSKYISKALKNENTSNFLKAINRLVKLGFKVAKIWPPNISTIVDESIRNHVDDLIYEFNEEIRKHEELLDIGIEIESQFSSYFNEKWDKLKKQVVDYLMDSLGDDNGYMTMMLSGGKGDENNILQIFGLKGRVQKNDISAFNSIISGSYSQQLTGLEGFVSAYGSRKGIADKVLATAEPGYLSRKLEHAGSTISITSRDCGTSDGIEFTVEDIVPFIEESSTSRYGVAPRIGASPEEVELFWKRSETAFQLAAASEYLAKIIQDRYCVNDDGTSVYIGNEKDAMSFIKRHWGYYDDKLGRVVPGDGVVKMRSPIHCKKPCCAICYGKDIAAGMQYPKVGRPVGFIAAQAIGEPGTQLTMKNFQKGGVVTDANLTSKFELIESYFELYDLNSSRKNKKGVISYDMLSPVEGYVKTQYLGNGSKRILVTETDDPNDRKNLISGTKKIIVHKDVDLKDYVRVGDSFQRIQGDLNMKEVLRYRGYRKAAQYLALMLYKTFDAQDVNLKHFEVIVSAMSCGYLITDKEGKVADGPIPYGKGSDFKVSSIVTKPEAAYGLADDSNIQWTLIGLKTLPKYKTDFFESLLMENMDSYIPRAILMNPNDSMTNPITRAAFGLNIGIGTDIKQQ